VPAKFVTVNMASSHNSGRRRQMYARLRARRPRCSCSIAVGAQSLRRGEGTRRNSSVTLAAKNVNGVHTDRQGRAVAQLSERRKGDHALPRQRRNRMRMAAAAGERTLDSDHMVCIMPLARGNWCSGTSMAYDVSNDDMWNAPNVRTASQIVSSIHNCSVWVEQQRGQQHAQAAVGKIHRHHRALAVVPVGPRAASGAPKHGWQRETRVRMPKSLKASAGFCSAQGRASASTRC